MLTHRVHCIDTVCILAAMVVMMGTPAAETTTNVTFPECGVYMCRTQILIVNIIESNSDVRWGAASFVNTTATYPVSTLVVLSVHIFLLLKSS